MTAEEKEIASLLKNENYEKAAVVRDKYIPSKTIFQAIIRWIDARRLARHTCEFKLEQQVWYWNCAGSIEIKQSPFGSINGRILTYACSCGERKTIKTI